MKNLGITICFIKDLQFGSRMEKTVANFLVFKRKVFICKKRCEFFDWNVNLRKDVKELHFFPQVNKFSISKRVELIEGAEELEKILSEKEVKVFFRRLHIFLFSSFFLVLFLD